VLGLLTLYRFCNAENDYSPQHSYLYILWQLFKHESTRKYAVKWILYPFILMKNLLLLFHIEGLQCIIKFYSFL